jgi:hypothetical protein
MAMNHAITIGELLRFIGGGVGILLLLVGALALFAGGMSDAPEAGDESSKTGCIIGAAGIVLVVIALAACSTPAVKTETVEVKVPVATTPLKPAQIPTPPAPLPKRPDSLSAAADILLSKVCELEGYVLKADPLLRVSAGLPQQALPKYPECEH